MATKRTAKSASKQSHLDREWEEAIRSDDIDRMCRILVDQQGPESGKLMRALWFRARKMGFRGHAQDGNVFRFLRRNTSAS